MSHLITANLEKEFRRAKLNLPESTQAALAQKMTRAASGMGVTRVQEQFFNPFTQTQTLEMPKRRQEINKWCRKWYREEPLVGAALELHTEFPLSDFHIDHEDSDIKDFFNQLIDDLRLSDFILDIGLERWICGESIPFGFFDDPDDPHYWSHFILLNPDDVEVFSDPMSNKPYDKVFFLSPDQELLKVVRNGPNHEQTGALYRNLPADVLAYAKANKPMPLNSLQVSHIKRKGNYFNERGEPIMLRIFNALMYRDKLREAQYTIADRHIYPTEFYKVGSEENPADAQELENFSNALAASFVQPNRAIVWHHALQIEWMGAAGRLLPLQTEFDEIEKQILAGLMISPAFIHGEGPTYANSSVALDVLIQRYLTFRKSIEHWILQHVFAPMARIHGMYKPDQKHLNARFRVPGKGRDVWLPKIKWDKENLRDDVQKINLMMQLMDKGIVPPTLVLPLLNLDPDVVMEENKRYRQKVKEMNSVAPDPQQGALPGEGGAIGPGGQPMTLPDMPTEFGEQEAGELPTLGPTPMGPDNLVQPEESTRAVGLPTTSV